MRLPIHDNLFYPADSSAQSAIRHFTPEHQGKQRSLFETVSRIFQLNSFLLQKL